MRIVIATPLYPPDNAAPAPYVKELATRLSKNHDVAIVAYTRLPEPVPGVLITAIDKRLPLTLRLVRYFFALSESLQGADAIIAENGPSVDLPGALITYFTRVPLIIHRGDPGAHERAQTRPLLRIIERFADVRAKTVIEESPLPRPDVIPFLSPPLEKQRAYEASWEEHLVRIERAIHP